MAAQFTASDLAERYGFTARHWVRLAAGGKIPGARQPAGTRGQWLFDSRVFKAYAAQAGLQIRVAPPRERKPLRKPQPTDCVYLIYSISHIKIGVSCNVTRRRHSFMTATPAPVTLLAKVNGSNDLESTLKRRFADDRAKGEWFRLSAAVREFVLDCQQQGGKGFIPLADAEAEFRKWLAECAP